MDNRGTKQTNGSHWTCYYGHEYILLHLSCGNSAFYFCSHNYWKGRTLCKAWVRTEQSFANELFTDALLCSKQSWWTSRLEPSEDVPFIFSHDTITYYRSTCSPVQCSEGVAGIKTSRSVNERDVNAEVKHWMYCLCRVFRWVYVKKD